MSKVISIPPSEEELRELYPQYTIREIAKMKGVSHSTVVNWLKKYKIPLERVGARGGQGDKGCTGN